MGLKDAACTFLWCNKSTLNNQSPKLGLQQSRKRHRLIHHINSNDFRFLHLKPFSLQTPANRSVSTPHRGSAVIISSEQSISASPGGAVTAVWVECMNTTTFACTCNVHEPVGVCACFFFCALQG